MKKKVISIFCTMMLVMGLVVSVKMNSEAAESLPMIDGSYLTHETESTGTDIKFTRGVNLQTGYSKILRMGPGVIYAGGTTIAQHCVESVQITVLVERASEEDEEWHYVNHWHRENKNADLVSANRRLEVEGGYYYRVASMHSADGDMSSSVTDGIFIEEP